MKKTLCIICVMLCAIGLLCGCQDQDEQPIDFPYDARFYDRAQKNLLSEEFLSENKTFSYEKDDNSPKSICRIIKNDDDFSFAFTSFPEELDFTHDTLIVYLFTDIYNGFECKLKEIIENGSEITIVIEHDMAKKINGAIPPSTSMPIQRGLVIKLLDCNINNIKVNLIYS